MTEPMMSGGTEKISGAKKYWAFISYSSKDRKWGKWLHSRLENYPIPKEFQGAELFDGATLGKDLKPCFRDRDELSGSADLGPAIAKALNDTRYLIVLCSPNSAKSEWVNKEIEDFKEIGGEGKILALILDGEPNSGGDRECFPPALRYPAEPLAGDMRKEGDGKERGFLKILSGIAQLDFDVLYRRHERAQRKKRLLLSSAAVMLIAVLSALSIFALAQRREAIKQSAIALDEREQAEASEAEALKERDNAKRTLARFYDERAEISYRQDPDKSLAWSVKAAEISPEILEDFRFINRNQSIVGSWSVPDQFVATQRSANHINSLPGQQDWGVSMSHERAVITSSSSTATLFDGAKVTIIREIDFTQTIKQVITPSEADWFALVGLNKLKVYRWSDGSLLDQKSYPSLPGTFRAHQNLVTRVYQDSAVNRRRVSIIYQKNDEVTELAGPEVPQMSFENFALRNEDELFFFTTINRSNSSDRKDVGIYVYTEEDKKWEQFRSNLPDDFNAYSFQHEASAQAVLVFSKDDPEIAIIDLLNPKVHSLNLADSAKVYGLHRVGESLQIVTKRKENEIEKIEVIQVEDLSRKEYLAGKKLSSKFFASGSGMVMGWERASEKFHFESLDGRKGSFRLPTLSRDYYYLGDACKITEFSPNLIGVFSHNQGGQSVHLVDLSEFDKPLVYTGVIAGPLGFVSVKEGEEGWAVSALTHRGKVLSRFSNLKEVASAASDEQIFELVPKFEMGWHSLDDDGQTQSWAHFENETIFYRNGKLLPHRNQLPEGDSLGSRHEQTAILANGNLVRCSYRAVQIFRPDGKLEFEEEGWHGSFFGVSQERAAISTKEGIKIIDCMEAKVLHLVKTPEKIEKIFNVHDSDDLFWMVARRVPSGGHFSFHLIRQNGMSYDEEPQKILITDSPKEFINGLMTRIEFLKSQELFMARSSFTSAGDEQVMVQMVGDAEMKGSLTLQFGGQRVDGFQKWVILPNGSIVSRASGDVTQASQLSHYSLKDGKWFSTEIALPSPLKNIMIAPGGAHCLLACEDGLILYDTFEKKLTSSYLNVSEREVTFSSNPKVAWGLATNTLLVAHYGSLFEFSCIGGEYVQILTAHGRGTGTITGVSISPNGEWISTIDRGGKVITTQARSAKFTLEELREKSGLVGGLEVENEQDLVPWVPRKVSF